MATETKTFYPGAYDTSEYNYRTITDEPAPVGKGSTNTDTYCSIGAATGNNTITFIYWPFDLSSIPNDATIDSVDCVVASSMSDISTTFLKNSQMQLYTGSTAKGSPTSISSTSRKQYTLTTGSWTRAELENCRLRLQTQRSSGYTSAKYIYFYGADLTVTYTYQSEKFMLKLGGSWTDVARVFKKVSGIWVEQTDLANVIEDGVRYKNGGEIESTAPQTRTVTITGKGHDEYGYVTINGVKYTSATTIEVNEGTDIYVYVSGMSSYYDPAAKITLNGTTVQRGAGTYTHTVDDNCTIAISLPTYAYTADITTGGGGESTPTLISFTIAGTSYQAEEGMTWGEWVASSYNTAGFYVSSDFFGGYVYNKGGTLKVVNPNGLVADPDETIASGYAYILG